MPFEQLAAQRVILDFLAGLGVDEKENRAGRAEFRERIVIEAPEGHALQGEVEVCFNGDNTLVLEFRAADSVPSVRPYRMELTNEEFQVQLEAGW